MSKSVLTEKNDGPRRQYTVPIVISQDHARQGPLGNRVAYVLGFGIAGAILANVLVFAYFALFVVHHW